ncbi:MAG: hypothetical protein K0S47_764 [Herbinix sp.]|jgi:uncharacterized membrane-anchored protein YitT (DUF2179 family)|nr:hypothetical protein [Herbinix sp.]
MTISKKHPILSKYIVTIVGAFLMALAVNLVFEPMGMVTGGISGMAIVVKKLTEGIIPGGFPIWLFNVLCNVPLFLLAVLLKGKRYIISAIVGTISYIAALYFIPIYNISQEDALLGAIFGGVIGGIGIGLVFSSSASTGGTDLLASLIQNYQRHYTIPQILTVIDGTIIILGAAVFGVGMALYAIIAVYITAKVSDGILEGLKFAKMAYIISDEYTKIADAVLKLNRGVTGINATGMYSNSDKKMLFCVVSKKEIVKIIEISQKIDPKCFIIISDVREVMGEGFIEYRQ